MKIGFLKAFLILVLFIFNNSGYSQLPQFVGEKIEITLNNNSFQVVADYYFKNSLFSPIKRNLFYPFPIDSGFSYPDSIRVSSDHKNRNISFIRVKNGIYFPLEIPTQKSVSYKVFYSQRTKENKAEYILSTTQNWGRALEKADFIINIPTEFDLKLLSYEFDKMEKVNNYYVYKIHKENFMPPKNLIVEWVRRKK